MIYLLLQFVVILCANGEQYLYENWKIFPRGSSIGIFLAVAIPLELKGSGASMSYNFEANYALPSNNTQLEYPPTLDRKSKTFLIDRKLVYDAIETKLKSYGYPGRNCVLRAICEAAICAIRHINGILGDILHILLTPSSSKNYGLSGVYEGAEKMGISTRNCSKYSLNCPFRLLDLITTFGNDL